MFGWLRRLFQRRGSRAGVPEAPAMSADRRRLEVLKGLPSVRSAKSIEVERQVAPMRASAYNRDRGGPYRLPD